MKRKAPDSLICLLIGLLFSGCFNEAETSKNNISGTIEYMVNNQNIKYLTYLSHYDSALVDHFPKVLDTNNLQLLSGTYNSVNMNYLEITNKIIDTSIYKKYDSINIDCYMGDDSSIMPFYSFFSWREYPQSSFNECHVNRYPTPDFRGNKYRDMGTESRLSNDFKIHILGSKPGLNIADSLIMSNRDLLERWANGYSRGVAISEEKNVIIYWVMVW